MDYRDTDHHGPELYSLIEHRLSSARLEDFPAEHRHGVIAFQAYEEEGRYDLIQRIVEAAEGDLRKDMASGKVAAESTAIRKHMANGIEALLERARKTPMTPAQQEAQRRSFAYGNAALSNPNVTREMIDRAADRMAKPKFYAQNREGFTLHKNGHWISPMNARDVLTFTQDEFSAVERVFHGIVWVEVKGPVEHRLVLDAVTTEDPRELSRLAKIVECRMGWLTLDQITKKLKTGGSVGCFRVEHSEQMVDWLRGKGISVEVEDIWAEGCAPGV